MVEVFLLDFIEIGFWGFQKGSHRAIGGVLTRVKIGNKSFICIAILNFGCM
jgi:hypothetical protein